MGSDEASDQGWPLDAAEHTPTFHHRPRRFPWGRAVLALIAIGALAWASLSPGGLVSHLTGVGSSVTGVVSELTENSQLQQATKLFDGFYAQQGSYPNYTQEQLDQSSDAGWGAGMDVTWCSPRDVVLIALTAGGNVSRLLLDGSVVGDVSGQVPCPSSLTNPQPWKTKS